MEGCLALPRVRLAHILGDTSLAVVSIYACTHTYSTLGWTEAPSLQEAGLGKKFEMVGISLL